MATAAWATTRPTNRRFTQPVLYRAIEQRENVREGYLEHLLSLGGVTRQEADEITRRRHELLEKEFSEAQTETVPPAAEDDPGGLEAQRLLRRTGSQAEKVATGARGTRVAQPLLTQLTERPPDFHAHPKIKRLLEARRKMAAGAEPLDWAAAEALAFATIAVGGLRVRLSGQDCGRGTFSQRHAVLHDFEDGHTYVPLQHLVPGQGAVEHHQQPAVRIGRAGV